MRRAHPPTTAHNYLARLCAVAVQAERGAVTFVDVRHDDWCDIYDGGFCNCDPEIVPKKVLNP